jgi:RHS repeat-associated protein
LQNYLAESDGTNTINVVYTNEPQQFGNLVSTRIGSTTSYHHFDALRSTRQLTNAAARVTDTALYDAWGSTISHTGVTSVNLLWIGGVGYYFDPETGLLYVRERQYSPASGRWTALDPADFVDVTNGFRYAVNSPQRRFDPSGLKCTVCGHSFAYRVAIKDLDKVFVATPNADLAVVVQSRVAGIATALRFGVSVPTPTTTGPAILFNKARTQAIGYFFFILSWPICETKKFCECRLWFKESGKIVYDDGIEESVGTNKWEDVTDQRFVKKSFRKKMYRFKCHGALIDKELLFADAPRANTTFTKGFRKKPVGFTLTVDQDWEVIEDVTGVTQDKASHQLSVGVDNKFTLHASP